VADEQQEAPQTDGQKAWFRSSQIVHAVGLPACSVVGAYHFIKGWKSGDFDGDSLEAFAQVALYAVFSIYYPLHAAIFWIRKRIAAGKNPNSDAQQIATPKVVQRVSDTVQRLTHG